MIAHTKEVVRKIVITQVIAGDVTGGRKLDLRSRTDEVPLLQTSLFADLRRGAITNLAHHLTPNGESVTSVQKALATIICRGRNGETFRKLLVITKL